MPVHTSGVYVCVWLLCVLCVHVCVSSLGLLLGVAVGGGGGGRREERLEGLSTTRRPMTHTHTHIHTTAHQDVANLRCIM